MIRFTEISWGFLNRIRPRETARQMWTSMKKHRVWWFIGFGCFLFGDLIGPSELLGLTAYDIPLIAYVPVVAALAVVIPFALRILLLVISVSALRLLRARKAEGLLLAIGAVLFLASKGIAMALVGFGP